MIQPPAARYPQRVRFEQRGKLKPGYFTRPETGKVRARDLAIYYLNIACPAFSNQAGQRNFGGVAVPAEHRFTEKHPAELYAVQAAHQFIL